MHKETPLQKIAVELLNQLPFKPLNDIGIRKDENYSYVFQYPPAATLKQLDYKDIYNDCSTIKGRKLGLYVHIPFCTGKCSYCYFTRYNLSESPISQELYIELLQKELEMVLHHTNKIEHQVTSIAFGGGTPTCLSSKVLKKLTDLIDNNLDISLLEEFSVEVSPETIINKNEKKLSSLIDAGVNRISIGVQSFNDITLKLLNRRHSKSAAIKAINTVRNNGIQNINIDLIYGFSHQTLNEWEVNLNLISQIKPASISMYRLRNRLSNNGNTSQELMMIMYLMAVSFLNNIGYIQVASHNFVLSEKFIQKHVVEKQGIEPFNLLGLGVSSYSFINNYHFWNHFSIEKYALEIQNNKLPIWIGKSLDTEELMRKAMVLGIHEYKGINVNAFKNRFNQNPYIVFGKTIDYLNNLNLLITSDNYIQPSYLGYIYADEICTYFYSDKIKEIINQKHIHKYGVGYIGVNGFSK